jgi:hypothetical protein
MTTDERNAVAIVPDSADLPAGDVVCKIDANLVARVLIARSSDYDTSE